MSIFKEGILVKSSLKGRGYSFSLGSEFRTVETVGDLLNQIILKTGFRVVDKTIFYKWL